MLFLAVLPSIVLFLIVWKKDKIEKEPTSLLLKLFIFGALSTVSAMLIGIFGETLLQVFVDEGSFFYILIDNFILTALVEEGGKYYVMKKSTWKHPDFNYTFDAVVYAVAASLGFATLENILYVIEEDIGVAIMRGVFSVPSHFMDAVFMGCYYGLAKIEDKLENIEGTKRNLKRAILIPVLLHGFYDFCLSTEYDVFVLVFLLFVVITTVLAVRKLQIFSREDREIIGNSDGRDQ